MTEVLESTDPDEAGEIFRRQYTAMRMRIPDAEPLLRLASTPVGDRARLDHTTFRMTLGGEADPDPPGDAPLLSASDAARYRALYAGGADRVPSGDPEFAPLRASDFRGLAPASVIAAEHDPLCRDALRYAERLREDGVAAACRVEAGLVHGFLRARRCSAKAAAGFAAAVDELARLSA